MTFTWYTKAESMPHWNSIEIFENIPTTGTISLYWLKKIPIHDILFVTIATTVAKCQRFHFPKKEYSLVYATVQFHLFFSNSAWYKNTLNTPGSFHRFRRIKSFQLLDLKEQRFSTKIKFSQLASCCIAIDILGAISQNSWGFWPLHVQEMKSWR